MLRHVNAAGNAAGEFDPVSAAGSHALRSAARVEAWALAAKQTLARRYAKPVGDPSRSKCPFSGHPRASARHFRQDCLHFHVFRREFSAEYGIPEDWWSRQPRCASKTGWVVLSAHHDMCKRTRMQIAACRPASPSLPLTWVSTQAPLCLSRSPAASIVLLEVGFEVFVLLDVTIKMDKLPPRRLPLLRRKAAGCSPFAFYNGSHGARICP